MLIVPQNAVAPTAITIRFYSPVFGPDLTTVTAVGAGLLRRDGTQTTLAFTIISATTRELIAQYTFQNAGELTSTGAYYLSPRLSVPGGVVNSESIPLMVAGPFAAMPQLEQDAWIMGSVPIPTLGPIKNGWVAVNSSLAASPYGPLMALDLRSGSFTVTLWPAIDGDAAELSDVYNAAGSHALTLAGSPGQSVPLGDGTYAASVTRSSGFPLRLRFQSSSNLWVPR